MEPILNRSILHFHLEVAIYHLQTALAVLDVETLLSSEDYGCLYAAARRDLWSPPRPRRARHQRRILTTTAPLALRWRGP
jgi:hypothetical protein